VIRYALTKENARFLTPEYSFALAQNFRPERDYQANIRAVRQPLRVLAGQNDEVFFADKFASVFKGAGKDIPVTILPGIDHISLTLNRVAVQAAVNTVEDMDHERPNQASVDCLLHPLTRARRSRSLHHRLHQPGLRFNRGGVPHRVDRAASRFDCSGVVAGHQGVVLLHVSRIRTPQTPDPLRGTSPHLRRPQDSTPDPNGSSQLSLMGNRVTLSSVAAGLPSS
jgi:hypothetical protein